MVSVSMLCRHIKTAVCNYIASHKAMAMFALVKYLALYKICKNIGSLAASYLYTLDMTSNS